MLLIVIAALCVTVVLQQRRAAEVRRLRARSVIRYESLIHALEWEIERLRKADLETAKVKVGDTKQATNR
jgi:hypothetical protein